MKRTAIALSAMLTIAGCASYHVMRSDVYELSPVGEVRKYQDGRWETVDADDAFIARLKGSPSYDNSRDAFGALRYRPGYNGRSSPTPEPSDQSDTDETTKNEEEERQNWGD